MIEQKQLAKIVGNGNVNCDQARLEKYSRDESFINPIKPEYVVKPRNPDDIEKIVAWPGRPLSRSCR